jgi:hypothetical protein
MKSLKIASTNITYDENINLSFKYDVKNGHIITKIDNMGVYYENVKTPICLGFNVNITQDDDYIYINNENGADILEILKKDIYHSKKQEEKILYVL